jgi:hypothetical protein
MLSIYIRFILYQKVERRPQWLRKGLIGGIHSLHPTHN